MNKDQKQFVNIANSRDENQRKVMEEIKKQGHCPFCRENLEKYHKNPILREGEFWILTDNQWPYEKVKHQLLAIYKNHIEHIENIDPRAGKELFEMFSQVTQERQIIGGGIAIRFGLSEHGNYGSTVQHIHAHLIEPNLETLDETEAWRFKFGQPKNYRNDK